MTFTREEFEQDKARYQGEIDDLLAEGFSEDDFRVRLARRRLSAVDRVLTDPRLSSLIEESKP